MRRAAPIASALDGAHLRLVPPPRPVAAVEPSPEASCTDARCAEQSGHVLVAGADGDRRAGMLGELRSLLPAETPFVEAREAWEVLACAPGSRMVVLTGDLRDVSTDSLMRVLGRRYPTLPVVVLRSRAEPHPSRRIGAI